MGAAGKDVHSGEQPTPIEEFLGGINSFHTLDCIILLVVATCRIPNANIPTAGQGSQAHGRAVGQFGAAPDRILTYPFPDMPCMKKAYRDN